MFDPAQLAALAAVHREGSFERAAAVLAVTPSAVSQRIKALEEAVGTLLVQRGQPARASAAGLQLVRHHERMVLMEQALRRELHLPGQAPARLRLAVNADSLATWLIPALAEVEGWLFDLVIEDQEVSLELLRRGEVLGAIAEQPAPEQGCDALALGRLRYLATASPAFIRRWFSEGPGPEAFARAPVLSFSRHDSLQARWLAGLSGPGGPWQMGPAHQIGSSQGFVDACLAGMGWALNPLPLVAAPLAEGRLVPLVPDRPLDVALYWHVTRLAAPALAPLTGALRRVAAGALLPLPA